MKRIASTIALMLLVWHGSAHAQLSQTVPTCPAPPAAATPPSAAPAYQPCYPYIYAAPINSQVTTGGTAVTAFNAYGAIKGGWLYNPSTATTNLCVAIGATAASTTGGATSCFPPGYTFNIGPTAQTVSVNASDSAHAFSGAGYQ